MRTITVVVAVAALLGVGLQAGARPPASNRSVVPRDPGFFSRMLGRGHPGPVRDALRAARGVEGAARDRLLLDALRRGIRGGTLSTYSAVKLSKAASSQARDRMLRVYARYHQPGLSPRQIGRLAVATHAHKAHNNILERYAGFGIEHGLSLDGAIKLSKRATRVEPANRILEAYTARHQGTLSPRELRRLTRARAVPASASGASTTSDDGLINVGGMNVGGINVGGINMGGQRYGGVDLGRMNVGGISVGGVNVGGVSVGGFSP